MMMMPAARSKSRLSGIFTIELAGSAIFSRAPLCPQEATTRSPTLMSVTSAPMLSTTPAISAAGENGKGGLIWYLPWIIRMSKKFSAAALIAITASPGPATGSGTSASTRSSGWQYCEQRMAFMAAPSLENLAFQDGIIVGPVLPDLGRPYNQDSLSEERTGLSSSLRAQRSNPGYFRGTDSGLLRGARNDGKTR